MSAPIVPQQPEPDGESIADVVRERHNELLRRNPPTLEELEEIARLQALLAARVIYLRQIGRS